MALQSLQLADIESSTGTEQQIILSWALTDVTNL